MSRSASAASTAIRTPAQNSKLFGLVTELQRCAGLSQEEATAVMRRHVREVAGQEHSSRLTVNQAIRVIDALQREVATYRPATTARPAPPAPHAPWGNRGQGPRTEQPITDRQVEVLQELYRQAGIDTLPRQVGFTRRQCKGRGQPSTQKDFDAIYEALSAIILRRTTADEIWTRARTLTGNAGLDAWQRGFIADLCGQFENAKDRDKVLSPHKLLKLTEAEIACGVTHETAPATS